jgi:HTH-type transcriptional regulator / antitoxin HigA
MVTLDFRRPHMLRNDAEYESALAEIEALMDRDPPAGTEDFERLEFLSFLVEQYEAKEFPTDLPSPQAVADFILEQRGMTRADLADIMDGKSRVSEFFAAKRELSINQVRALRDVLGIPADLLIGSSDAR